MADKIRVLHFIYALKGGGAERQLVTLVNALDRDVFSSAICCADATGSEALNNDIDLYEIPRRNKWDFQVGAAAKVIRGWRPDILHNWLSYVLPQSVAAHLSVQRADKKRKLIFLANYRGIYRLDSMRRILHALLFPYADKIVANMIDTSMHQPFRWIYWMKHGEFIPNAVDYKRINAAIPVKLDEFDIPPDAPTLIYVGRMNREKNVTPLIQALAILGKRGRHPWLLLCGNGVERNKLEAMGRALGVSARLVFAGYRYDIYGILKNCKGLILPSLREGMPNVLFEAMVAGIPVIASDIPTHRYWINDNQNGLLFNPNKPIELADRIEKILNFNPQESHRITENARTTVANITVDRMVKSYEALYRRISSDTKSNRR